MLSDKFIHSRAKNEMTYRAGMELYAQNSVEQVRFDILDLKGFPGAQLPETHTVRSINSHNVTRTIPGSLPSKKNKEGSQMKFSCTCSVQDGTKNHVVIQADENGDDVSYTCSCPSYWSTWGACKHIIAAMKTVGPQWEEKTKEVFTLDKSAENKDFFDNLQHILSEGMTDPEGKTGVHIVPSLHCETEPDGQISIRLEISVGKEKQYMVKDLRLFLSQIEEKKPTEFSKLFTFDPNRMAFDYKSKQLVRLLRRFLTDETRLYQANSQSKTPLPKISMFDGRMFKMGNTGFANFFDIFQDEQIDVGYNQQKPRPVGFSAEEMPLLKDDPENGFGFSVSKYWKNHLQFQLMREMAYPLSADYKYLIYRNTLYRVNSRLAAIIRPMLEKFAENGSKPLIIASTDTEGFFTNIVLPMQQRVGVSVDPEIRQRIEVIPLQSTIRIDQDKSTLLVKLEFSYPQKEEGKIRAFDRNGERQIFHILEKFGFLPDEKQEQDLYSCSKEDQIYAFLTLGIPRLQQCGKVMYSENFKPMKHINSSMIPQISFGLEGDLFEVSFEFQELSFAEIQECLRGYRIKKNYYRLKNGEFLDLGTKEFHEFSELIDGLGMKERDIKNQPTMLPLFRSMYLDQIATSFDHLQIVKKDSFLSLIRQMKDTAEADDVIPASLRSTLREYQKQGVLWLGRLHKFHFGGILADDMGLGKTLQIIAFLLSEKKKGAMPSLVVAPTSLVYNWEAEVRKFAPELSTLLIQGGVAERDEKLAHIAEVDLVVTSYALLRRDIAKYQTIQFRACIIDEAQNIKNPKTINSKSVKQVRAYTYFALTGTPIENSLTELWSIFDFLMPGYLFSHPKFQEQFELPIFRDKDQEAVSRLKHLITPFILRRMKKDVLKELPEKINSVLYNEMTNEQSRVYASYILTAKSEFQKLMAESPNLHQNRFEILSLLTRLRQICCHPSLFLEDYKGDSGKLDQAMELIEEALSGQHRILIFSQFTSMLEKVKEKLDLLSLDYFYLDGKTPVGERKSMIDDFQAGSRSLFLLSLKAGGTGLNLTGADMVVHLDPWWNPAVEDQATDRVYRIGQTNRVQVFKLITKDSIEEKIFALQEKKNAFVSEMIRFDEENPIFTLNQEELISLFDMI